MKIREEDYNRRLLWCPFSKKAPNIQLHTKGHYPQEYPRGAVIHYTAGRSLKGDEDAIATLHNAESFRHNYFCISSTGTIFQNSPLDLWGYHAGDSEHPDLGKNVSRYLVGIEICCAGKLDYEDGKHISWFKEVYPPDLLREYDGNMFHKFTQKQEQSLTRLLIWLKANNELVFDFNLVVGHEEVSPHKSDPGGSLSMRVPKYREYISEFYDELKAQSPFVMFSYNEEFGVAEFQNLLNNVYGFDLDTDGIPGFNTSTAFHAVFGMYLKGDPRQTA